MAKAKPVAFSEQLRQAIRESGLSMLAVGRETDIDKAALSRFLSGERGLRLEAIDRLCALLRVRIVTERARGAKKR